MSQLALIFFVFWLKSLFQFLNYSSDWKENFHWAWKSSWLKYFLIVVYIYIFMLVDWQVFLKIITLQEEIMLLYFLFNLFADTWMLSAVKYEKWTKEEWSLWKKINFENLLKTWKHREECKKYRYVLYVVLSILCFSNCGLFAFDTWILHRGHKSNLLSDTSENSGTTSHFDFFVHLKML